MRRRGSGEEAAEVELPLAGVEDRLADRIPDLPHAGETFFCGALDRRRVREGHVPTPGNAGEYGALPFAVATDGDHVIEEPPLPEEGEDPLRFFPDRKSVV